MRAGERPTCKTGACAAPVRDCTVALGISHPRVRQAPGLCPWRRLHKAPTLLRGRGAPPGAGSALACEFRRKRLGVQLPASAPRLERGARRAAAWARAPPGFRPRARLTAASAVGSRWRCAPCLSAAAILGSHPASFGIGQPRLPFISLNPDSVWSSSLTVSVATRSKEGKKIASC